MLGRLAEVAGTRVLGQVAMIVDYECLWAVERDSLPISDLRYRDRALALYRALWDLGVTVDFVAPGSDLGGYPLVLAPTLHLVSDADAAALTAYVASGGHLLTTYFSGIVDEDDHVRLGGYPGAFRDLLGIRVEEFCPLPPGATARVCSAGAGLDRHLRHLDRGPARRRRRGRREYIDGPLPSTPCLTRHPYGEGMAWYLATRTDPPATAAVLAEVLAGAGLAGSGLPAGVELVRRGDAERTYAFVLNHTADPVTADLRGHDLVSGTSVGPGGLHLGPGEVACVRETGQGG